jgi:hypothetical protein
MLKFYKRSYIIVDAYTVADVVVWPWIHALHSNYDNAVRVSRFPTRLLIHNDVQIFYTSRIFSTISMSIQMCVAQQVVEVWKLHN